MLASWIALIVLFLINGLNLHGDLTIKPYFGDYPMTASKQISRV